MRLFIAIRLPEGLLRSLCALQEKWRSAGVRGNYTPEKNMHLTLAFIGEYGDPLPVEDVLGEISMSPFPIRLEGVGAFGDLLWAGMDGGEELVHLVKRIRRALSSGDIPFDRKKFVPHITLVRRAEWNRGLGFPTGGSPSGDMLAESFSLMRSDRGRHGMIYTELQSFPQPM